MASTTSLKLGMPNFLDEVVVPCAESFPDAFFSEEIEDASGKVIGAVYKYEHEAKTICSSCPVRLACLQHALANKEQGIWGGTTENERTAIKRSRINPADHIVTTRRTGRNR